MPKKLSLEEVRSNLEKKDHVLLSTEYTNSKTKLVYLCGLCGNESTQTYSNLMRDIGHECQGKGITNMNKGRFLTLNRYTCKYCEIIFYLSSRRTSAIFCSLECKNNWQTNTLEGIRLFKRCGQKGIKMRVHKNRSKNEIYMATLCEKQYGYDKVLKNVKMFDGIDADIIIPHLKVAIEWNGIWHYKKVRKDHNFNLTKIRDKVKAKTILNHKYNLIHIKDMGKNSNKSIEKCFKIVVDMISSGFKNLQEYHYIQIDCASLKHIILNSK